MSERIAKMMARAGLCSRRDAERWIAEGRVMVDGEVLTSPAIVIDDRARVRVDGKPLPDAEAPRLWRYHKPRGLVTTARDEAGRRTVFDALPDDLPRVISVGRLDISSEGLLLLTNDGALARRLELPATGWKRRYRVRVYGNVRDEQLAALADGITIEGVRYEPIAAEIERRSASNAWVAMTLTEGKNREIRRVCQHLGLEVNRLIRVSYGPFTLGGLARGEIAELSRVAVLSALGEKPTKTRGWAKAKPRTGAKTRKPRKSERPKSHAPGRRPS